MLDAVGEQRAVGQPGQRVVQRLVEHRVDAPRVGQRQRRVLGKGRQHVLLGAREDAAGPERGEQQAADDATVLVDRRGHRGLQAVAQPGRPRVGHRRVVLDDDQPRLGDRAAGHAGADAVAAAVVLGQDGVVAALGGEGQPARVVGIDEHERGSVVAEQLAGGG